MHCTEKDRRRPKYWSNNKNAETRVGPVTTKLAAQYHHDPVTEFPVKKKFIRKSGVNCLDYPGGRGRLLVTKQNVESRVGPVTKKLAAQYYHSVTGYHHYGIWQLAEQVNQIIKITGYPVTP